MNQTGKRFDILRTPVITEKSTLLNTLNNQVVIKVDIDANKYDIKKAVEDVFKVQVEDVRTIVTRGKMKRVGQGRMGKRPNWKKAIVKLASGSKLDFTEGVQ